jgi:hypothetical protein
MAGLRRCSLGRSSSTAARDDAGEPAEAHARIRHRTFTATFMFEWIVHT